MNYLLQDIKIDNVASTEPLCKKIMYKSFRDAQEAINYARGHHHYTNGKRVNRRMGKKDIRPLRSYKCDDCGFWHLTSQPKEY